MSGANGNGHRGEVRLVVPARSESLAVVRQIAAGAADAFGLDEEEAADLKVVVAEASSNVVRHAFNGEQSPRAFEIEIKDSDRSVVAIIRDRGGGFIPTAGGDSLGLGIPIMASISRALELRSIEGGGVQLRAEIPVARPARQEDTEQPARVEATRGDASAKATAAGSVACVTVGSVDLLRSVLARLVGLAAARAGLTTDELADGLILSDALAGAATWDEPTELAVTEHDGNVRLTIGPLPPGAGQGLIEALEVPGVGSLTRVARRVSVEISDGDESPEELTVTVARREAD